MAINYDRLLEIRNLATEIVSSHQNVKIKDVLSMINRQSGQIVGKTYITFGKEVNLKEYF